MHTVYRTVSLLAMITLFSVVPASADNAQILENCGKIPLAFTVNDGQLDSQVKFTTSGSGCDMFFTPTGTTFLLSRETAESAAKRAARKSVVFKPASGVESGPEVEREAFALKVAFVGANDNPEVSGEDRLPWNNNYFIGNDPAKWRIDVPNYGKVRLKEVYSGVDLVYYGNKNRIKYDFVVKPGEDPSKIALRYDLGENGGNALSINENGELVVKTPLGEVIERKPYCYQKIGSGEAEVPVVYRIIDARTNTFGFEIGEYDPGSDLCIDPEVVYSKFLGGSRDDVASDIAVDSFGNAYIIGRTNSSDYPVTGGAFDTSLNSQDYNVFVTKLNAEGSAFVYSTFLGGNGPSDGRGIAVDGSGNAYATGYTLSSDYPVTAGAFDSSSKDGVNYVFVTKLNSSGSDLVYSVLIGGASGDLNVGNFTSDIVIDGSGRAYMTGWTYCRDYPVTTGAFDTSFNGGEGEPDAFVTELNANGTDLVFSTFLGGSRTDRGSGIALDSYGYVYVAGSSWSDFPVTGGAFDTSYYDYNGNGYTDAFVTKLNPTGSALVYSTFLGGWSNEYIEGITVDEAGNAYVAGYTASSDYPVTNGAFDTSHNGNDDIFITKLNPSGSSLVYSTFLGGARNDFAGGIATDHSGNAYVTGYTTSPDFPVTNGSYDSNNAVFITKLNPTGSALITSAFLGGGVGIDLDDSGNVYTTGNNGTEVFIKKINMTMSDPIRVIAPVGSEYWLTGTTQGISWVSEGLPDGPLKIDLFREQGAVFERTIVNSTPNTGSYNWTIPADIPDRRDYRIRITSLVNSALWDESDSDFRIGGIGVITVTAPTFHEYWTTGTSRDITWQSDSHAESLIKIELFREDGETFDRMIAPSAPNNGLFTWTIPSDTPVGDNYRVRVSSLADSTVWNHSDSFIITNEVSVSEHPAVFRVFPPTPNPFNPSTAIRLEVPRSLYVHAAVYDILGQEVCVLQDGILSAGAHALVWNGRNRVGNMASSGVYFYTVRAGEYSARGKMLFLR